MTEASPRIGSFCSFGRLLSVEMDLTLLTSHLNWKMSFGEPRSVNIVFGVLILFDFFDLFMAFLIYLILSLSRVRKSLWGNSYPLVITRLCFYSFFSFTSPFFILGETFLTQQF